MGLLIIAALGVAFLFGIMTHAEIVAWVVCGMFVAGVCVGSIIGNGGSNAGRSREELDEEQSNEVKEYVGD